jgi:hypothetical protein
MGHHKSFTDNPMLDPALAAKAFKVCLGVGIIGVAASFAGMGVDKKQFFFSWLVAFWFFLTLALGGMFFSVLHHLVKAGWSTAYRRIAETFGVNTLLMAVLFIPILIGMHDLYHWTHADVVASDKILQWKQPYLNVGFFMGRAVFFFGLWILISHFFRRISVQQDASGDESLTFKMRKWAPLATIAFALSITFAGIDWVKSLDPHWFSTMFGVCMFAGTMVAIFAALALFGMWLTGKGQLTNTITIGQQHDAGKMMFGFLIFWTYVSFCQYYLIWYANIPEETVWYVQRLQGGWERIGLLLLVGHFFIPFWFLLSRHIKRNRTTLAIGASWMLFVHYMDIYYYVMPVHHHHLHFSWMDLTSVVGIGGLFLAVVFKRFQKDAVVAHRDPQLVASMSYDNA